MQQFERVQLHNFLQQNTVSCLIIQRNNTFGPPLGMVPQVQLS